ncbi:uncharacterized protein [Misgurnus anguillicaudatus]|uniref:uncharacterized protein n=1 Tax=Misgurnus anguillicaudatus TaxID=75329 RepID=UPI003CCF738C
MSKVFYDNIIRTKGMKSERVEMTVDIYESADTVRDHDLKTDINTQQPPQHTGSGCVMMRRYRSVTVCLVLLCVLLLTAVIVLCVLINTNNQQCHNKKLTEERDQLLTNISNLTKERDQLLTKYTNITKERDQLLTNNHSKEIELQNLLMFCFHFDVCVSKKFIITSRRKFLIKHLHEQDKWIYNQSSFYFISSENKSWSESRIYCRERGADLIIINNKEEQDFVKNAGIKQIWIGLSDSDEEDRWKWVDNSTLTSSFWGPGEPNGGTRENCVESYPSEWNDINCNTALKWICEKNILK